MNASTARANGALPEASANTFRRFSFSAKMFISFRL
jgi:hypothetical protein